MRIATRLAEIADAFLVGQRPIARRVEDSVARSGTGGPVLLRRSRGYAPGAVATLPTNRPTLAIGADLKNTVTLVVDGQAFMSQHVGDLDHYDAFRAFHRTVEDLLDMYRIRREELLVVRDAHPEYRSSVFADELGVAEVRAVQHHRAHEAGVLAEHGAWDQRVVGISLDGTGYGDDGTIWGGEIFVGSLARGMERVAHLRPAPLAGGDAAALHPVQAAAGFLSHLDDVPDLRAEPFGFPDQYDEARLLLGTGTRVFTTTSVGRLFDAAAALTGFVRPITFEGQAAIWLEQLARGPSAVDPYPFPYADGELDFRPLLRAVLVDRVAGRPPAAIARAFHLGLDSGSGTPPSRWADATAWPSSRPRGVYSRIGCWSRNWLVFSPSTAWSCGPTTPSRPTTAACPWGRRRW